MKQIEARTLARVMSMTDLGILQDEVLFEIDRRRKELGQGSGAMPPANEDSDKTEAFPRSEGAAWSKESPEGKIRPMNAEAVQHEADVRLGWKERRRANLRDMDDERQADRMAKQVRDLDDLEQQRFITRMICKHDVQMFRLDRLVRGNVQQVRQDLVNLLKTLEERRTARRHVENAHSSAINELDTELQKANSLIKTLFALIEKQNGNIESLRGLERAPATLERRVKAIESRLAKDWDKKRR